MNKNMGGGDGRDSALEKQLAGLKNEFDRLRLERARTEEGLANLERQLRELEEQARREYGTCDPEELEALLASKRKENEELVARYAEHIDAVCAQLDQVEKGLGGEE
jgi:chromosome segregation ATPase